MVGLTFPNRPRSLWLFYDYKKIDDDEYGIFELRTDQEYDRYTEAVEILKGEFDLG